MAAAIANARDAYLLKARREALDPKEYPDQLIFMANGVEMCEMGFVHMLGVSSTQGFRSPVWVDELEIFTGKSCHALLSKTDIILKMYV